MVLRFEAMSIVTVVEAEAEVDVDPVEVGEIGPEDNMMSSKYIFCFLLHSTKKSENGKQSKLHNEYPALI